MIFFEKLLKLFKKEKPKESVPYVPKVLYDFQRGTWKPSEPKYETINLVLAYLKTLGFDDFKAVTNGETSSHHWTFSFSRTYDSMDDFLLNSRKDFEKETEENRHGPDIDWDTTAFTVEKSLPEGKITMLMLIHENDHVSFTPKPEEVKWVLSYPLELKETELIKEIRDKVKNL